jgi:transcription initiation factor TFIIH subunit 2
MNIDFLSITLQPTSLARPATRTRWVQAVSLVPPYGVREALVLLSSLTTCDPGSVSDAIKEAQKANLRVSIIGLSAEMYISSRIAAETSATYRVATSEEHLKELVMAACAPPALQGASVDSKLVRMGFPSKDPDGAKSATFAGEECSVMGGAYTCPACGAKNENIPCECHVCKLTLISAAHLARSYHHLFPIEPFQEVDLTSLPGHDDVQCKFCERDVPRAAGVKSVYRCGSCKFVCCAQCDEFIHENLHNCPGCEAPS